MTVVLKTSFLSLGAAILLLNNTQERVPQPASHSQSPKPIVVMVEKTHGRLSYKIDSKAVDDPLFPLGALVKERGENYPVVVILPWDSTFREEMDMEVIASKAGFRRVRSFLYDPNRGFMVELKWGPSIPFTTDPPSD